MIAEGGGRPRTVSGYAMVAGAAMTWGFWPLVIRETRARGYVPPAVQATILASVVAATNLPFAIRTFRRSYVRAKAGGAPLPTLAQWNGVLLNGVADAANMLLLFAAYARTTVAVAVLSHYLAPLFVAALAPAVLGERLRAKTLVAIALSFAGLVVLLRPWHAAFRHEDAVGAALGAGSALGYAVNVLCQKRLSGVFSGPELVGFHSVVTAVILAFAAPFAVWGVVPVAAAATFALGAFVLGAVACLVFVWGLARIPAGHASTLTLLEPLVAVGVGAAFLGQAVGPTAAVGAAAILGGAVLVVAPDRRGGVVAAT